MKINGNHENQWKSIYALVGHGKSMEINEKARTSMKSKKIKGNKKPNENHENQCKSMDALVRHGKSMGINEKQGNQ